MKRPTPEQQRAVVKQWQRAAPALRQARDDELRNTPYDWKAVESLLDIGATVPARAGSSQGIVAMQNWFTQYARQHGLVLNRVRESKPGYDAQGESPTPLYVGDTAVAAIGNPELLDRPTTGVRCSRHCPAATIMDAHARFKALAGDSTISVVSGFHSPVEQECLRLLLKGEAGIIVCPAREIATMRIAAAWRPALDAGRLLILSPFTERRPSAGTIDRRNRLVAELADELYLPYASADGHLSGLKSDCTEG